MNWYYSSNGQQVGPVSEQEIESQLRSQGITSESLVWKEGMANWQPAGQIFGGLAGASAPARPVPHEPLATAPSNYGAGFSVAPGGGTVNVVIKKASFSKFLTLVIVGWVLLVIGSGLVGYGEEGGGDTVTITGAFFVLAGLIPLVWGMVLALVYLYRCWLIIECSSNGIARTTPGRAVGFMFIPFYNLYWVFQAYAGWAKDYNALAQRAGWQNRVPEGLFTAYSVLTVLGLVPLVNYLTGLGQLVVAPMTVYHMCRTINYHANA